MLKAIFVDFDGTLVDSLPALWKCYCLFLSHHGIDGQQEEFASLMGPQIGEIVDLLKAKHRLLPSTDQLIMEYEQIVAAAYATNVVLFPNATEVLQQQKILGRHLAIVTAAPESFVSDVLRHYGILELFDAIFGRLQGEPSKPHPAVYLRALQELKLQPNEVLAIEDSPSGLKSACQAGIATITFEPSFVGLDSSDMSKQPKGWQMVAKAIADFT